MVVLILIGLALYVLVNVIATLHGSFSGPSEGIDVKKFMAAIEKK